MGGVESKFSGELIMRSVALSWSAANRPIRQLKRLSKGGKGQRVRWGDAIQKFA